MSNENKINSILWYKNPANDWNSALPVGNGRLGAMIHGGVFFEDIQLNEDSIWYGKHVDRNNPDALKNLPEIRRLLFDGKIKEAEKLSFLSLTGTPDSGRPYQTLGNLYLNFNAGYLSINRDDLVTDYKRELDLGNAIVNVSYKIDSISYKREYFSSEPDQLIVVKISADKKGKISFISNLRRILYFDESKKISGNTICLTGNCGDGGVKFCIMARVECTGGNLEVIGDNITVENADSAIIFISTATSFYNKNMYITACKHYIDAVSGRNYNEMLKKHTDDYKKYYNRVSIKLSDELDDRQVENLATDERLERIKKGEMDNGLISMYFQFGRYLLISCSRPGTMPATLQGLWNKDMLPPWGCKFTININTQMNYWPAEVCNLPECHLPLFDLLQRMRKNGRKTAKAMYNCRGFTAHHNTDIWADTSPQDTWIPGTYWPMGAAWLCIHIWEHYEFTCDNVFLKKFYPIMKEASLFFIDFLIEDDTGHLVTCPSVSPENSYKLENGEKGSICIGSSIDSQIIFKLLNSCLEAEKVLDIKSRYNENFRKIIDKLHKPVIGKNGMILEWTKDYEEVEPGHRHISHLFALHPGNQITVCETPELARAAEKTLENRLAHGGGHTGWSRAWIINFYARLQKGDKSFENIMELLKISTLPNLFDNHPPFQIDGNFGGTAGIAEMLVQSHSGEIHLLPALPRQWHEGHVKGLVCRGGQILNLTWKENKLESVEIKSIRNTEFIVRYGEIIKKIELSKDGKIMLDNSLS